MGSSFTVVSWAFVTYSDATALTYRLYADVSYDMQLFVNINNSGTTDFCTSSPCVFTFEFGGLVGNVTRTISSSTTGIIVPISFAYEGIYVANLTAVQPATGLATSGPVALDRTVQVVYRPVVSVAFPTVTSVSAPTPFVILINTTGASSNITLNTVTLFPNSHLQTPLTPDIINTRVVGPELDIAVVFQTYHLLGGAATTYTLTLTAVSDPGGGATTIAGSHSITVNPAPRLWVAANVTAFTAAASVALNMTGLLGTKPYNATFSLVADGSGSTLATGAVVSTAGGATTLPVQLSALTSVVPAALGSAIVTPATLSATLRDTAGATVSATAAVTVVAQAAVTFGTLPTARTAGAALTVPFNVSGGVPPLQIVLSLRRAASPTADVVAAAAVLAAAHTNPTAFTSVRNGDAITLAPAMLSAPTAAESFVPAVTITDALGIVTVSVGSQSLLVNPALAITLAAANSSRATVTSLIALSGAVQGGTPPYTLSWALVDTAAVLPAQPGPSASPAAAAIRSMTLGTVGTFAVQLSVSDGGGGAASLSNTSSPLTVVPAAAAALSLSRPNATVGAVLNATVAHTPTSTGTGANTVTWRIVDASSGAVLLTLSPAAVAHGSVVTEAFTVPALGSTATAAGCRLEGELTDSLGVTGPSVSVPLRIVTYVGAVAAPVSASTATATVALLSGGLTGGIPPLVATWTAVRVPDGAVPAAFAAGPLANSSAVFAESDLPSPRTAAVFNLVCTVRDASGAQWVSPTYAVRIEPRPLVADAAASPTSLSVTAPFTAAGNCSGGVAPFALALDLQETAATALAAGSATAAARGAFSVTGGSVPIAFGAASFAGGAASVSAQLGMTATDASGVASVRVSSGPLVVYPRPRVAAARISAASVAVGETVVLSASGVGGGVPAGLWLVEWLRSDTGAVFASASPSYSEVSAAGGVANLSRAIVNADLGASESAASVRLSVRVTDTAGGYSTEVEAATALALTPATAAAAARRAAKAPLPNYALVILVVGVIACGLCIICLLVVLLVVLPRRRAQAAKREPVAPPPPRKRKGVVPPAPAPNDADYEMYLFDYEGESVGEMFEDVFGALDKARSTVAQNAEARDTDIAISSDTASLSVTDES